VRSLLLFAMLTFGRVPVPPCGVPQPAHGKLYVDEEKEQTGEMNHQHRSRYYGRLAVVPTQLGLSRPSSHPINRSSVPIPTAAASTSAAVSRFARSTVSSSQSSHSLPSTLRRSQPIDIPAGPRSTAAGSAIVWQRKAWQGVPDDTDGSTSGDSDGSDEWFGGDVRQLSESFVDDSQLEWSGRCLDEGSVDVSGVAGRQQLTRWNNRLQTSDSDDDDENEVDAGSVVPFPLLAPSYHVDFELQ